MELERDSELNNLMNELCEKLEGYPLALGIAASTLSYTSSKASSLLLKTCLQDLIRDVDSDQILFQQVNKYLATNYTRTLVKVWSMALARLKETASGSAAVCVLWLLASVPPEKPTRRIVTTLKELKNMWFCLIEPTDSEALFEAAVHELEKFGLLRLVNNPDRTDSDFYIIIHRLVQKLAKRGCRFQSVLMSQLLQGRPAQDLTSESVQEPSSDLQGNADSTFYRDTLSLVRYYLPIIDHPSESLLQIERMSWMAIRNASIAARRARIPLTGNSAENRVPFDFNLLVTVTASLKYIFLVQVHKKRADHTGKREIATTDDLKSLVWLLYYLDYPSALRAMDSRNKSLKQIFMELLEVLRWVSHCQVSWKPVIITVKSCLLLTYSNLDTYFKLHRCDPQFRGAFELVSMKIICELTTSKIFSLKEFGVR